MSIIIGVTEWTLDQQRVDAIPRAKELGFDAIQLRILSREELEELQDTTLQAQYRQAADAHNIPILAFSMSIFDHFAFHKPEHEDDVWQILTSSIDVADAMGVPVVYCPSFQASQMTTADEITQTAKLLRRAIDYTGDRPIELATENTLDVAGHRALLQQVNHPKMKVLVDSYNAFVFGHKAADQIHELRDSLLNQVHAKDGLKHEMGSALLGQGEGNFEEATQALQEISFSGYVFSENEYGTDTAARTTADIATLKRLLNIVTP